MVWYSVMWCNDGKAIQVVVSVLGYGTVCEVWWDTVLRGRSKVRPQEKKYGFIWENFPNAGPHPPPPPPPF